MSHRKVNINLSRNTRMYAMQLLSSLFTKAE
nr:MAG TPA: hypothetical protein [Caudoviricetes sp.]